jgi:inosose dehydratase
LLFDPKKTFLGITPTVWTNDDLPTLGDDISFEQCISEMALAGFQGCSVGHKYPRDPKVLKPALELRGLRVSEPWASTYFTVAGMEERTFNSFREQMAFIKAMGGSEIVVAELGNAVHQQPISLLPNKPVMTQEQWSRLSTGLNRLGKVANDGGMRLCYHHHMGTVVQTRAEVDRLLEMTEPGLVNLLLDTGHLHWAGDDPLALARDHAKRIKHVHLTDIRDKVKDQAAKNNWSFLEAVMEGVFTVPGDGDIDFKPILESLSSSGFEGWLVVEAEQDAKKAHPLTYAKKARSYLRDIIGW